MYLFAISDSAIKVVFTFPSEMAAMNKSESGNRLSEVIPIFLFYCCLFVEEFNGDAGKGNNCRMVDLCWTLV